MCSVYTCVDVHVQPYNESYRQIIVTACSWDYCCFPGHNQSSAFFFLLAFSEFHSVFIKESVGIRFLIIIMMMMIIIIMIIMIIIMMMMMIIIIIIIIFIIIL